MQLVKVRHVGRDGRNRVKYARRGPCSHCGRVAGLRPRRLCWPCYYAPGVRDQHPKEDVRMNCRGVGNITGGLELPASPTICSPGTAEKIAVMIERAKLCVQLHHPQDAVE